MDLEEDGFVGDKDDEQSEWEQEVHYSLKNILREFHRSGEKIYDRYLDDRDDKNEVEERSTDTRLNMFWANTKILESVMYASLPQVDVSRKFDDANDDVARVASAIMKRAINYDIAENGREYDTVLRQVVQDRLIVGMGAARVFYDYEEYDEDESSESASIEYYYWKDVCWSWARSWETLRWVAFRNYMTKKEINSRFGEGTSKTLQFSNRPVSSDDDGTTHSSGSRTGTSDGNERRKTAEVWEIWDKENMKVIWMSPGAKSILDEKDDPLGLKGFFPCPPFLASNVTNRLFVPRSDFSMAQDIYNELDVLSTRISILTDAAKVIGVYDAGADAIKRMFEEGVENELIPVDNWAMFAEKGGLAGQIDWLPLKDVVEAIVNLRSTRDETISLLQKITGMSDIITGDGTNAYEGVGTQEMKAEYGSARIQAMQEELARFATDLCELKAEVMSRHFEVPEILRMANVQYMTPHDQIFVEPAMALLKNWESAALRFKIAAESMAMVDYSRLRQERTAYIEAMSMFLQSSAPLVTAAPNSVPFLLEMLQWGMAGFKGSDQVEGILDTAIKQFREAPPQGEDDGKAEAEKIKAQAEIQREQMRIQGDMQKIQAKLQADMQVMTRKFQLEIAKINAKGKTDVDKEQAQSMFASMQSELEHRLDVAIAELNHAISMKEIEKSASVRTSTKSGG